MIAGVLVFADHMSTRPARFNEGDMGVYGIAVLGFFSCGILDYE